MKKKILLNYLPPSETDMPSAALSIIKTFMQMQGYDTEIKYWNLLINKHLIESNDGYVETTQTRLLPFCYIISEKYNDKEALRRIKSNLQAIKPSWIINGTERYGEVLEETKETILDIFKSELDKIDVENILIFGISSKFYQWIPGTILAGEIKKRNPTAKIIIGGFESSFGATEIMEICPEIDYAVWGEGEYILLEVCKQLETGNNNFDSIARLVYRENGTIKVSSNARSKYLDFENYIYPDYSDFVTQSGTNPRKLPINSIRGCPWKRCKFCNYSHGYKYRERSPESIIEEINYMTNKYNSDYYVFVDNDIIGIDIKRFEKLLNLLIENNYKENNYPVLWGEFIVHKELTVEILKKLPLAGFSQVSAGYEAIADSILKKMDKSNGFANNILLIKGLQKAGVNCPVNLIKGIPNETENDVIESIENLHYLRFFYSNVKVPLNHILGFFNLKKEAKYFNMLTAEDKEKYFNNTITLNLPTGFIKDKFNLFGYNKPAVTNERFWNYLLKTENHYKNNSYTYTFELIDGKGYYYEYCKDIIINRILFYEHEYIDTLRFCSNVVCNFDGLHEFLKEKYNDISTERVKEILQNLKGAYLIYFNEELTNIVSIIDVKH